MIRKAIMALVAASAPLMSATDLGAAGLKLARSKDLGVEVVAPQGDAWCAAETTLEVLVPSKVDPSGAAFHAFMAKVAKLLQTECAELRQISYVAITRGKKVGRGTLSGPAWTIEEPAPVVAASLAPTPAAPSGRQRYTRLTPEPFVPGSEAAYSLYGRQADPSEPWRLPGAGQFFIRSLDLGYVCLRPSVPQRTMEPRDYVHADYCVVNSGTPGWRLAQGTYGYLIIDAQSDLCLTRPGLDIETGVNSLLNTKSHYKTSLHIERCIEDPKQAWRLIRVENYFVIATKTDNPQLCLQFETRDELANPTARRSTRWGPCPDVRGAKIDKRHLFALESGDPATQQRIASIGEAVRGVAMGVPRGETDAVSMECDYQAAHPGDPERQGDGIAWSLMDGNAARAACEAAVKAHRQEPRLRFQLARAQQKQGNVAVAADAYRKLDRENYPAASYALALIEDDAGNRGEGVRLLIRAARADHTEAMFSLAVLHFANGDDATGTEWLRQAAHNGSARAARLNDELWQARLMGGIVASEMNSSLEASCRITPGDLRYTGAVGEVDAACYANGFAGATAMSGLFNSFMLEMILSGY